mmetsp:Transcript_470/g.1072  ORF Transcript_470/g.1072 Transcript_470/m.1072 type:complete len:1462 (+) Transcript_470:89-4474(+)
MEVDEEFPSTSDTTNTTHNNNSNNNAVNPLGQEQVPLTPAQQEESNLLHESSSSSLSPDERRTIQSDLEHVEETLARPGRGRAAFDSVTSTLRSLRRRLTQGCGAGGVFGRDNAAESTNHDATASATEPVTSPVSETHERSSPSPGVARVAAAAMSRETSQSSTVAAAMSRDTSQSFTFGGSDSADDNNSQPQPETQLVRRLEQAEIAHASGIPLGMLHSEMQRRQQEEEQAVAAQKSEGKSSEDDENNNNEMSVDDVSTCSSQQQRRRRASTLVASRISYQNLRNQAIETELHGNGNDVALPRILDHDDTETAMQASKEDAGEAQDLWTESHDNDEMMDNDFKPPSQPKSVLYSWGVPRNGIKSGSSSSNSSNSSQTPSSPETCPQSLHDDEQVRTLTAAKVDTADRLGRYTIVGLHTGPKHSAVVTATGEVLASGSNESGQVDPYRRDDVYILKPTLIESLSMARIRQVACGRSHTAALVAGTGQVLTWGSNSVGQLGRGPTPANEPHTFRKPAAMILGPGVRASTIACGHDFTAVLTTRMRLLLCGSQDVISWDHDTAGGPKPRYPSGLAVLECLPLIQVAAGARHVAVVTQGGMVYAWGHNSNGCCGREFPESIHVPVSMLLPETQRTLPSTGAENDKKYLQRYDYHQQQQHSMVLWDSWDDHNLRVSLPDDVRVVHAACGSAHTVLLTQSGSARVFGLPRPARPDDETLSNSSRDAFQAKCLDPPEGRKFIDAAAGDSYSMLLDDEGDVWCLRGDHETAYLECVLKGQGIVALSANGRHAAALASGPPSMPLRREFSSGLSEESSTYALARDPSLLVTAVSSLVPQGKANSVARAKLVTGTEELFKSPAVWNSLFYNPDDCRDLYASLLNTDESDNPPSGTSSLKQDIATAIEHSMLAGLELLRSDNVRMIYPESVRVLWFYLQNPLFSNWRESNVKFDYRGDLILTLCDTMLGLPFEGYKALMAWTTLQYNRNMFREYLIKPLVAQLERGLVDSAGARFRAVPAVVAVLRWLFHAAEQSGVAPPEDFYSDALGAMDPQELYDDLRRYKAASPEMRKNSFFICATSFLLSPTTKRNLLQVEHQVDMLRAATSQVTWDPQRRQFLFDPYFVVAIDRQYLLQQTLQKIGNSTPTDLRKSLKVVFKGEDGVDAGGVTKEFFQLLSQELFDVSTGMWSTRYGDRVTWFNGDCTWNFDGYYLVGILVGLALYNSVLLDVHFPAAVYRKLLGRSLGLEDMVDEELKNGLQALLDYDGDDVEDVFCLNFEVTWTSLGSEKRMELKPNGANIPVTSSNKEEYVLLYVRWLLVDSIQKQWEAFENGVMHVLDGSSLDLLRPDELERLVVGTAHLDYEALRQNTVYEGGYDAESAVVQNFWKFCLDADSDTQVRLLKFATGSPKAPIGGLAAMPFKIQRAGPDSQQLPTAHTCFNTLLLPDYGEDYSKLSRLLGRAILDCEGFGLQ